MVTPPSSPSAEQGFFDSSGFHSSADSVSHDNEVAGRIAALPAPQVTPKIPLTDDQKKLLQKTLDKYQISPSQALAHPSASVVGTLRGGAAAVGCAMYTPIPFTSWHAPVLPLLSCKFIGVKKTLGLAFSIAAGGALYGWYKAAAEIYQKTPEDNLKELTTRLSEDCSSFYDRILEARLELLKAKGRWNQLVPQLDIDDYKRVQGDIEHALNLCADMTVPPVARFYEKELEKQHSIVLELNERVVLLQTRMDAGEDVKLECLRALFEVEKERSALSRLNELLENSRDVPVQNVGGHLENLGQVEFGLSTDCKMAVVLETYKNYLAVKSQLDDLQAQYIAKQTELINILVDEQRFHLARSHGMKTEKEGREGRKTRDSSV